MPSSSQWIEQQHAQEISSGERFSFGENWSRFITLLNEDRIGNAVASLKKMLHCDSLEGKSFIDIGSGSGLFSLAARRLGARVFSFDYDPKSFACTTELRRRYYPEDPNWHVEHGSVLDPAYLASLGTFDIVYSWGVLHHTGHMWDALTNIVPLVAPNGLLFIAIYNDQGTWSKRWTWIKKTYCSLPPALRFLMIIPSFVIEWGPRMVKDFLLLRPFATWRAEGRERGMSAWYDLVDWVGGYPFEVAKPEELFRFYRDRGFELVELVTAGGTVGCIELVMRKRP